jgi:hypothetical protein
MTELRLEAMYSPGSPGCTYRPVFMYSKNLCYLLLNTAHGRGTRVQGCTIYGNLSDLRSGLPWLNRKNQ